MDLTAIGKILALIGVVLLLVGGSLVLLDRLGLRLGQLPGDIRIQTDSFSCAFPLVSSILISLLLTVVLNVLLRWLNK
ncbi:MAG TPA: DUF2905 domain-containing protein [Chloroflexi bacterium]|nr:DUF2905 domain-containing protein [Chloroflexota bacterium]